MILRPQLRFGSTGPAVKLLQQALNLGESALPNLADDGIFGPKTHGRVVEYQRKHGLAQDGIVGEQTHGSLEELYKVVATVVNLVRPPPEATAAREAIVNVALASVASLGWPDGHPGLPPPESGRIVTRKVYGEPDANEAKKRYGGFALATILQIAGDASASRGFKMSKVAQDMYEAHAVPSKELQNLLDLHDWCARFCTYVYRTAGLKIQSKDGAPVYLASNDPKQPKPDFVNVARLKHINKGDMGIVSPNGRNHHFLIIDSDGITFKTIDGNAGSHYSIVQRSYTIADTARDAQGYYRINSPHHGIEPFGVVSPDFINLLKT
jgi:hypothetical protein